jgi:hypothetical protein
VSWPAQPGGAGRSEAAPAGAGRRPAPWWLAAIILLVAAGVVFTLVAGTGRRSLPGPLHPGVGAAAASGRGSVARSLPVTLNIPAIGVHVALSQLGLNRNGTVQVPASYHQPGWYRYGPSPGQAGSAVILGHVDSYQGPGVFFKLRTLRPGDEVEVTLADGVITHFLVRQVAMYAKAHFPTTSVYGSHGYSGLQLVTCGGVFDTQTRSYLSNIVVYTRLAATNRT